MRKFTMALGAALILAVGSFATGAMARGGHGGHFGGHFGGGHYAFHGGGGHFAFHGGHFRRGFGGGIFIGAPYAYYGYGYDTCYRPRLVPTPYGLRWRRVWVCG
jgi:hypothetical protein